MTFNFDNEATVERSWRDDWRTWAWLAALGAAAVVLRVIAMGSTLPDHDAVNFALGLDRFDLEAHRPHFPGYPVFLALAWPLRAIGLSPAVALALPAVALSAVTVAATGAALLRYGRASALLGAALVATLPGLCVADATPLSDGLGAQLVALGAAALFAGASGAGTTGAPIWGRLPWARLAVVAFALLPGIRASSVLIAAVGLALTLAGANRRERLVRVGLAAAVAAAWLAPLVALAGGPAALIDIGARFTRGHFEAWGGTALAAGAPGATERLTLLAHNLFTVLLGPAAAATLGVLLAASRPGRRWTFTLLALALPYAAWVAIGQNPEKPRHLLPLLPLLVLGAAPATARVGSRLRPALALAPIAIAAVTLPRLVEASRPSPAAQAGAWLAARPPEQLQVYAGEETGVLRFNAPAHRSVLVRDAADVLRDVTDRGNVPRTILVTSGVRGAASLPGRLVERARFERSPLVDPHAPFLVVWEWRPNTSLADAGILATNAKEISQ